jgi:hypothetical protein
MQANDGAGLTPHVQPIVSRDVGERCVEIARQVRDGEFRVDIERGAMIKTYEVACMGCGCATDVIEYENCIDGGYCAGCHHRISQEIYEHEVGLLNSGFYG